MELTIADKVNANPTAADIAAALSATSFPEDWSIALDDNMESDVMIDAEYDPIGTFRVSVWENSARLHAVQNPDAVTLGKMLVKFLARDKSWRDICQWESPEEAKARVKDEGFAARQAESAAAAVAPRVPAMPGSAILSAVGFVILVFGGWCAFKLATQGTGFITDRFPKAEAKLAALTGGMGLVALLMAIAFYRRAREAQRWPKATGRVIVSKVERYTDTSGDSSKSRSYRPVIEFAYSVDGTEYCSKQRQLGVQSGGSERWARAVTAKYSVGSAVEVRYDPANPATAALENPIGMTLLILGASVLCLAVCIHALHVAG
jgi:hypothetical protein